MGATSANHDARLNFRLSSELKRLVEEAAAQLGQSVSDYAVSTLARDARDVIERQARTELSQRDRDTFLSILADTSARPNKALTAATRRYKRRRA